MDFETLSNVLPSGAVLILALLMVYRDWRKGVAETAEAATGASENASQTMEIALAEMRRSMAEQAEKNALMRKASLEKDIQHTQDIRDIRDDNTKTKQELAETKMELHKTKEALADEIKKRRALEDKVAKLEIENAELRVENAGLKTRMTDYEKPDKDKDKKAAA